MSTFVDDFSLTEASTLIERLVAENAELLENFGTVCYSGQLKLQERYSDLVQSCAAQQTDAVERRACSAQTAAETPSPQPQEQPRVTPTGPEPSPEYLSLVQTKAELTAKLQSLQQQLSETQSRADERRERRARELSSLRQQIIAVRRDVIKAREMRADIQVQLTQEETRLQELRQERARVVAAAQSQTRAQQEKQLGEQRARVAATHSAIQQTLAEARGLERTVSQRRSEYDQLNGEVLGLEAALSAARATVGALSQSESLARMTPQESRHQLLLDEQTRMKRELQELAESEQEVRARCARAVTLVEEMRSAEEAAQARIRAAQTRLHSLQPAASAAVQADQVMPIESVDAAVSEAYQLLEALRQRANDLSEDAQRARADLNQAQTRAKRLQKLLDQYIMGLQRLD